MVRFGIDKTKVDERSQAASARTLARLLDIDAGDFTARVRGAGDRAFVEALVLRAEEVPPEVGGGYDAIPGALAVTDEIPLAPTREFARPILGTVGPVTAEIIEDSDGAYHVGDQAGLSGLQQRYDDALGGQPGIVVQAERTQPGDSWTLFRVDPRHGTPLRLTLDQELQLAAEQILADVGPASALVAIRPSDGHVLAAASGPGTQGYPTATIGRYAPGSTFKVVTSLALLRAGLSAETVVSCTDTLSVNGKSFKNYDDYPPDGIGDISLRTSLAHSCNTSFIAERDQATQAALADAAATLGLGVDHDLGFPAYLGSIPDRAGETEHAASMIRQGKVLASPLAMAAVAASVAEGETVVPRLLRDDQPDDIEPDSPLTDTEAEQLRAMMRSVVTEGSGAFLSDVAGEEVLAKTGTAEFGEQVPLDTHAWMIAVQGDLAVAAFVEVGDSGSHTAGPLLEEFLRAAGEHSHDDAVTTTSSGEKWPPRQRVPAVAVIPIAGLAWWLVGYLPWFAAGLRGSLESEPIGGAGAGDTVLALPLVSSSLALLVLGALVGGLTAGTAGLLAADRPIATTAASFTGTTVAVAVTLAQSVRAVQDTPAAGFATDDRVLAGLCLAVVATALTGWVIGAIAIAGPTMLGITLAVLAGALPTWLTSTLLAVLDNTPDVVSAASTVGRWAGAAGLVTALLIIGARPLTRLLAWPLAFVLAWLVGPSLTAAGYLEQLLRPSAGLPGSLNESLDAVWQVFTMAASPTDRPVTTWVVALLAATALAAVGSARGRRSAPQRPAAPSPVVDEARGRRR